MVMVACRNGDLSQLVPLENVTQAEYEAMVTEINEYLSVLSNQDAVEMAFVHAVQTCPDANPSDLWRHVVMQEYIAAGRNDNSWKKASGKAFEYAISRLYNPVLEQYELRLRVLTSLSARTALDTMVNVAEGKGVDPAAISLLKLIAPSKLDIAIDGRCYDGTWRLFGVIHSKTSIAERIKDDTPASVVIMNAGFYSILVTLDHKCYPVPHGDGINYGELGGRTPDEGKIRQKRNYVEVDGDFHNLYSFSLRTPASPDRTASGAKVKTLRFYQDPDPLAEDLFRRWRSVKDDLCSNETAALA